MSHENAARGHIAFSHFGDAAAVLSARGLVHKSGGMLPSAKAHAYARPILLLRTTCTCTYARAAHCTHARAVRHRILAKNQPR